MNLSPIKRALLALALCLAVAACARGRRFERFPPAIDHDRVEQRMDAIRADERAQQRRRTASNTLFVELNLDEFRAAAARREEARRREASKRSELQRQFEDFSVRARVSARATRERQFIDFTGRVQLKRKRRIDERAAASEALLSRLRRAEAQLEDIRRRRLARNKALLEHAIEQAERNEARAARIRARQQGILERERATRQAQFGEAN